MKEKKNLIIIFINLIITLIVNKSLGLGFTKDELITQYNGEKCIRQCVQGNTRICYFHFTLEFFHAMGPVCGKCRQGNETDCNNPQCIIADGIERGIMSINRQLPGPSIQVCKDDLIVVDVKNAAMGTSVALHWHGLHMRSTPWSDGVPFVTQCPIEFNNVFRYKFYATESGTQFYHAHAGHHKINGQYGGIVIRVPPGLDPNSMEYDYDRPEHLIVLSDWMHSYAEMFVPGLPSRKPGIRPDSVLINGRGQYIDPIKRKIDFLPPMLKFEVDQYRKYRFRLIDSASHTCALQFQIENHNFKIIASDSYNLKPKIFNTLVLNAGERYDFVLEANQPPRDYLIRLRATGTCTTTFIESFAILSYVTNDLNMNQNRNNVNLPSYDQPFPKGNTLNSPDANCDEKSTDFCITEMEAFEANNGIRFGRPDATFYLGFAMYPIKYNDIYMPNQNDYHSFTNRGNGIFVGAINKISNTFAHFPLLTQREQLNEAEFCSIGKQTACEKNPNKLCYCNHVEKVPLNGIIEMIVVDESVRESDIHHPFHMHGYRFQVIALNKSPIQQKLSANLARSLDQKNMLPRNLVPSGNPPWKDTVSIPSTGYAVIRFRADNPGFWLLHCHYEWHLGSGMALVLQVGETSNMQSKIPPGFPKCGNFLPDVSPIDLAFQNRKSFDNATFY